MYFKRPPTFSQSCLKNQQYNILSANALTSPNKIACVEYYFLDGGLRVPNFRTKTYIALEQRSAGVKEKGERV